MIKEVLDFKDIHDNIITDCYKFKWGFKLHLAISQSALNPVNKDTRISDIVDSVLKERPELKTDIIGRNLKDDLLTAISNNCGGQMDVAELIYAEALADMPENTSISMKVLEVMEYLNYVQAVAPHI